MLPRLVLLLLQVAAGWYIADWIAVPIIRNVPALARPYDIFVYAVVYALIIMVVGYSGSLVLKGVRTPSGGTLLLSLALALILAGLTLVPAVTQTVSGIVPALRTNLVLYPFAGALIGYYVKR
jgi:hypothetical protein